MTFVAKDWRNFPDTATPINAVAIEDLETRVSAYTDPEIVAQTPAAGSAVLDGSVAGRKPYVIWRVNMNADAKLFPLTNAVAGASVLAVVKQDATGNRAVSWQVSLIWEGGVAPGQSVAANAIDVFSFWYDGTAIFGSVVGLGFAAAS